MNLKTFLTALAIISTAGLSAEDPFPLDFLVKEGIQHSDLNGLNEEIESALLPFDNTYRQAVQFASSIRKDDPELNDAILKRLEIAVRLKNYITARKSGSAEMRVMAWQGAKELTQLLRYFKAEADNDTARKKIRETIIFSIRDFGARGDGISDDGPAFRKAIAAASENRGKTVTLHIPSGTYLIKPSAEEWNPRNLKIRREALPYSTGRTLVYPTLSQGHLVIANLDHLTLAGEKGTRILFSDATKLGFRIVGCRNMKIKDFSIDYAVRPFTQGTVVQVEKTPFALIFRPQKGYPAPNEERFMKASARRFTPHQSDGLYGRGTVRMGKIEALEGNLFRLFPQDHDKQHHVWLDRKAGDVISIIARWDSMAVGEASAMDLRECGFCEIRNITLHKSPGVGFRVFNNYALRLIGCRIEPVSGSGDLVTTNADGCQTTGIIGPYVANCYFSGMEDDGFNIHSSSPEVADLPAPDRTQPFASQGGFLISGVTGELKALLRPRSDGRLAYTRPLPAGIHSRKMSRENLSAHQKEALNYYGGRSHLYLDRPDRISLIPGDLTGTVITDTEFFNIRGMALQLTAPNLLVENCKISHMNSYGINISALLPWGMTFNPHNVVIRNTSIAATENPSISLRYRAITRNGFCKPRFINNILIENCEIKQKPWCAVELRNASDVTIENCRFYQNGDLRNPEYSVLFCDNFADLCLKNNKFFIKNKTDCPPVRLKNPAEKNRISESGTCFGE